MKIIVGIMISSISFSVSAFEISNFKSGLACSDENTIGWICFETDNILVTGQGTCVYGKEKIPCTWYGYEFEYTGNSAEVILNCEVKFPKPTTLGNPEGITHEDTDRVEFELEFPDTEGRFFNPLYIGLNDSVIGSEDQEISTTCLFQNEVIFEFTTKIIYPENP